ncbi:MAG: hypothetical protein GQ477_05660 [Nanohaloarchaea archaeon]|nr:hypothetical protein [Candidatus Nanohaloarchaea archaeon]
MKRKIIRLGDSYAISLPKGWIEHYAIKKSDEVDIEEINSGTLTINCLKKETEEIIDTIHIDRDEPMEHIFAKIYRSYINGFKTIILTGQLDKNQYEVIKKVQKRLIGLEVMEQSEKRIIFKDFIHIEDIDLDKFTSNIFNHLIGMATELADDIKNKKEIGDKIKDMDAAVDRTTNLVFRCLNLALKDSQYMKKTKKDTHELMILSRIIKNLEKIGNMLVGISYYMNETPTKNMKEYGYMLFKRDNQIDTYTIQFLNDWIGYIKPIRDALFKKKTERAIEIYTDRRTRKTMDIIFKMQNESSEKENRDIDRAHIEKLVSHFEPVISLSYDIAKDVIVL